MCIPKVEPHEAAAASGAHDEAAAAFGAMRVDQDEEVEDETILQEFQQKTFVPWLQGLTGEAKGTLAHELEEVLLSKFGSDQKIVSVTRSNRRFNGFRAPNHLL